MFLKIYLFYLKFRVTHRGGRTEKDMFHLLVYSSNVHRAGQQEDRNRSFFWDFLGHKLAEELEVEQPGYEPVPIGDVCTSGGGLAR